MKKIIIIGKVPNPIGGVTIHVSRLIDSLGTASVNYHFISLSEISYIKLFIYLTKFPFIHLHTSNPFLRFTSALISFIFRNKIIITFHGNLGRYNKIKNLLDLLSVKFAHIPIVLNEDSFKKALLFNKMTQLIPAFIPPKNESKLPKNILLKIKMLKKENALVFCTNAYNVSFDSHKREVYSISHLIRLFTTISDRGLIISDPSGEYIKYIKNKKILIPKNVVFFSEPHDFIEIIKNTNCFIRATTTDGDSLSVKEALYFNIRVIASDCVPRPNECLLFSINNFDNLKTIILNYNSYKTVQSNKPIDGSIALKKLYDSLLKDKKYV